MAGMVIIGAGHAAGQAAASLRQEKYTGPITIIGDEEHVPYQRPPLSKAYLSGAQEVDRVYLRPEKFYQDKDIELKLATRATAIDADAKTVEWDEEPEIGNAGDGNDETASEWIRYVRKHARGVVAGGVREGRGRR